ncbi:MAG TPA: class II aldolase/adducin family protein [Chloroflexia bacterium]|nr:class II aldolase/adducin family protein [Chloroflexia bacterium]
MPLTQPYPGLDELIASIGEAGQRLNEIKATEGAAGNISVYAGWPLDVQQRFSQAEQIDLPQPAPALAGKTVLVTGSGRRLRDIEADPEGNLGAIVVDPGGLSAQLFTSPRRLFTRITSEFNSHLAAHQDAVARTGTNFQALVHAQPPNMVYLSHIPAYRDQLVFNRRLLRWQPETIVELPDGVCVLPFLLPGSHALMDTTVAGLRDHNLVLWSKHGVMARSDISAVRAADIIEYAEAAAHYEYMDLVAHSQADGLTPEELSAVAEVFGIKGRIVDRRS